MKRVLLFAMILPLLTGCLKDDYVDYAAVDEKLISEYIADNNIDATRHSSGLYYQIIEEGDGDAIGEDPNSDDKVTFSFTSKTIDGADFYEEDKNHTFNLSTLAYGFQIGMSQINKKGKIILYTPSQLCRDPYGNIYGKKNTVMIYHIDIKRDQTELDEEILAKYLAVNQIEATRDESGLYYNIIEEGDAEGDFVSPTSSVKISYVGTFLDGEEFDKGETVDGYGNYMSLTKLIEGWRIAIPKLKKGGKATLYCPSQLAYGSNDRYDNTTGKISLPGNSILIFEVNVVDFR